MNNQGFTDFSSSSDVPPEAVALPFKVARQSVVIEAGFADGDDLSMVG